MADNEHLVQSDDQEHPANNLPALCAKFYTLGWVPGTGGGASIRDGYVEVMISTDGTRDLVYLAPSGVSKELMKPEHLYVMSLSQQTDPTQRTYIRSPPSLKPSACTPLFLAAFTKRNAACCIHTHSQWAVLVTMLLEQDPANKDEFQINNMEQIKAFGKGFGKKGNLENYETLTIPIIDNTPHEVALTDPMADIMDKYPDASAVLVRRHGVYVWGESVAKAKAMAESLDYLFQLAVEMKKLGLPWVS